MPRRYFLIVQTMRLSAFTLICCLAATPAFAADPPGCQMVRVAEWTLRGHSFMPAVLGEVSGEAVEVVLDPGQWYSSISLELAQRHGLKLARTGYTYRQGSSNVAIPIATIDELKVGSSKLPGLEFMAFEGVQGITLGHDILRNFDVEFDAGNRKVRLFRPRNCGKAMLAYWAKDGAGMVPISGQGEVVLRVAINGVTMDAKLHMTTNSFIDSRSAARAGVTPASPGAVKAECPGTATLPLWRAQFDRFTIGDQTIRSAALLFGEVAAARGFRETGSLIWQTPRGEPDAWLGYDFMRAHRVLLSFSQERFYFTHNGSTVFPEVPLRRNCMAVRDKASLDELDAMIREFPDAMTFRERGSALVEAKEYARGIADFDQAIRLQPNAYLFAVRGYAHNLSGEPAKALEDFNRTIELGSKDPNIYILRARAYRELEMYEQAFDDVTKALAMNPADAVSARLRAHYAFVSGRYALAREALEKQLGSEPRDPYEALWLHLARAKSREGAHALAEVVKAATTAPPGSWPEPLFRLFLGTLAADALAPVAAESAVSTRTEQQCEIDYFVGQWHLLRNNRSAGLASLDAAVRKCPKGFREYSAAHAELLRLRR